MGSVTVVANDKEEMNRNKKHIAYICPTGGEIKKAEGKNDIANKLFNEVVNKLEGKRN